jgi:peptidoglycan/xylan/chitin deacetylase (PgdA/CDA1 family)
VIYLTFDDGPSEFTPQLLKVLEKYNVKATFFVVGTMSLEYLDEIAAGGHTIGIHSDTHDYESIYSSDEAFLKDMQTLREKIHDRTGIYTNILRFPGGSSNTISKRLCKGIMTRLTQTLTAQGYRIFDWNVDSKDAGGATTTEEVVENVINGIKKRPVSVVLQHDIRKFSVDAVEQIIIWGLDNGYTFLPLDETSPICQHTLAN